MSWTVWLRRRIAARRHLSSLKTGAESQPSLVDAHQAHKEPTPATSNASVYGQTRIARSDEKHAFGDPLVNKDKDFNQRQLEIIDVASHGNQA